MKLTSTIMAALLLLAAIGCEAPGEPEDAADFHREIDGPPYAVAPPCGEDLLEDQRQVAGRIAREAAAAEAAPAVEAPPAGGDLVESLKQRLAEIKAAADAGRPEQIAELYPDDVAKSLKQVFALSDPETKLQTFEQLVRSKFGDELADEVKSSISPGADGQGMKMPGPKKHAKDLIDAMNSSFEVQGETVIVTKPDGSETKFARTAGGWRIQLEPIEKQMVVIMVELVVAQEKILDAMTAGINDGSITKDNFDAKGEELAEKLLKPSAEKFAQLMGEMMKKAFEGMGKPTDTAPSGVSF